MAAAEEPTYEFDVALSFAGEDREYVEEISEQLKAAGMRVFYDTNYQADMWGEDLVEYLDQVYRVKARYAIIFVSRHYAEKMWPRHERRSALARALEQGTAYVLPVRLDDTPLDGLRPTIGYIDARRVGQEGIVSTALNKIIGSPAAEPSAINRVPRTEAERQQVLVERPIGWEYLYFAGQLLHERENIEGKYRDFDIHYAPSTDEVIQRTDLADYISRRLSDAVRLARQLNDLVSDSAVRERAFGAPGEAGDPARLAHLAKRWNSVYEEFLDWAASLRGVSVPSQFHRLLELLARYAEGPVEQYRQMVDEYVANVDKIPASIVAGEPVRIQMSLVISIPDEVSKAYNVEFDRVVNELRQ